MTKLQEIEGIVDKHCYSCDGSKTHDKKLASAILKWHNSKHLSEDNLARIIYPYATEQELTFKLAEEIAGEIKEAMDK